MSGVSGGVCAVAADANVASAIIISSRWPGGELRIIQHSNVKPTDHYPPAGPSCAMKRWQRPVASVAVRWITRNRMGYIRDVMKALSTRVAAACLVLMTVA